MTYILKITTRYVNSEANTVRSWGFMSYDGARKKMIEELESLHRQIMATELTDVTGYTIMLNEWMGIVGKYKKRAWIDYDLAL